MSVRFWPQDSFIFDVCFCLTGDKVPKDSSGSPTIGNNTGNVTVAAAVSNSAFFYKGTWIPLVPVSASHPSKTAL